MIILKNKKYKRLLELSEDALQITTLDSRFYRRNGKYYPSITHVLSVFPKGPHYEDWLKKHGYTSEHIARKAAEQGTETHELCESYLLGEELHFLDDQQNVKTFSRLLDCILVVVYRLKSVILLLINMIHIIHGFQYLVLQLF